MLVQGVSDTFICFAYFIAVFLLNPWWNVNVLEPLTEPNILKTIPAVLFL